MERDHDGRLQRGLFAGRNVKLSDVRSSYRLKTFKTHAKLTVRLGDRIVSKAVASGAILRINLNVRVESLMGAVWREEANLFAVAAGSAKAGNALFAQPGARVRTHCEYRQILIQR